MEITEKIAVLERDLRILIRKWERFFAGDLKIPPNNEREAFYRRMRMIADEPGALRASDRFRLDQLLARWGTYSGNWERMLREREEGIRRWTPLAGPPTEFEAPSGEPATETVATPPRSDVRPNVRPAASVDRPKSGDLFARWSAAKEALGQEVRLDEAAFRAQIENQRKAAEAKLGAAVQFDVAVVDGKVKLTARRAAPTGDSR